MGQLLLWMLALGVGVVIGIVGTWVYVIYRWRNMM
jgi:hypothetical protein